MSFPNLPSTDDAWAYFLHLAPLPVIIVTSILLIRKISGWYDAVKSAIEKGRSATVAVRGAVVRMRTMRRSAIVLAMAASLLLLVAQGVWLAFNFLLGNVLSGAFNVNHMLHDRLSRNIVPTWGQFAASLHWDAISAGYLFVSTIILVRAYILSARRKSADGWANLFSIPGWIYGFCGLAGGTLYFALNMLGHFSRGGLAISWRWVIFMLGAGVIGSLYVLACRLVFRGPLLAAGIWSDTRMLRRGRATLY